MTKKFRFFEESFAAGGARMGWTHGVDAWGGRMRWERVDATRRGRRGYFARRAVGGEVAAWAAMGSQAISVVAKIS